MSEPQTPPDEAEEELQALFEATAEPPSREEVQRMARRAATIPERSASRWWGWLPSRWPLLALGAAGAAAAAWMLFGPPPPSEGGPATAVTTSGEPAVAVAPVSSPTPPSPLPAGEPGDEGELVAGDEARAIALERIARAAPAEAERDAAEQDEEPVELVLLEGYALASMDAGGPVASPLSALDLLAEPDDDEALEVWSAAYLAVLEGG